VSAAGTAHAQQAWVNGLPADTIAVWDRGLQYGDALFETMACRDGVARFMARHLARLHRGCERLGFPPPDDAQLSAEVAAAAGAGAAVVKLLLTRGRARARGYAPRGDEVPLRILLRYPAPAADAALTAEGVRVTVSPVRLGENPLLAGLKHANRLEQVLARRALQDAGIMEALMFSSSGALIGGTMSNVFLVHGGVLQTPQLERCGVAGVMRAVVLELAAQLRLPVEERTLGAAQLHEAQELFLTNALIGIRPVRELEGAVRAVGPVTRVLQAQLAPLLGARGEAAHG
jgi:4-amino-4-deoxychorismate lyase